MKTITADNHEAALQRISDLMDENPMIGTPDADELQELAEAVSAFEETAFPIGEPTAQEAADFRASQEATHILFYKTVLGKAKEKTGALDELRAWVKKEYRANNILAGSEIEKL